MSRDSKRERAKSPETPVADLYNLAEDYPEEVLENPLLPLLALEDPGAWQLMVAQAKDAQGRKAVARAVKGLSFRQKVWLAARVAERHIPLFEKEHPHRAVLRKGIRAIDVWLAGKENDYARTELAHHIWRAGQASQTQPASFAAKAVSTVLDYISIRDDGDFDIALTAAAEAVGSLETSTVAYLLAKAQERWAQVELVAKAMEQL